MTASGGPQAMVRGEYNFWSMVVDDAGKLRPTFKREATYQPYLPEFYLYFLNGEWGFGTKNLGFDRNIVVAASELPHQVTDRWSSWDQDRAWVESDTFRVHQQTPTKGK